ncbi:hypothetical protein LTR66_012072, partial [Elasticomyces elasticus]
MEDDSAPSSPDELALSPQSISSPTKRVRKPCTRVPLTPQGNGLPSSPVKCLTMDTGSTPGASPWRIKVTVQAEPMPDGSDTEDETSTRNKLRKTVTTRIPLKDVASTTPVKRRGRSRKTDGPGVAGKSIKRRSTPTRRKTTVEASVVKSRMVDHLETMGEMTVQSAANVDQASRIAKRAATPLMDDSLRQKVANLNRRISDARACHVVVESSAKKTNAIALESQAMQESGMEDAVNDAQHEEDGNIWDSESLNVASVESLPKDQKRRANGRGFSDHPKTRMQIPNKGADVSYMPSSPPVLRTRRTPSTVAISVNEPPPLEPPVFAPLKVTTPMRQSTSKSARTLQGIIGDAELVAPGQHPHSTRTTTNESQASTGRLQPGLHIDQRSSHGEDESVLLSMYAPSSPGKVNTRSPKRQAFTPSKYLQQKIFEDTTLSSQHTEPAEQSLAAMPTRSQDQTQSMSSPLALKEKVDYPTLNRMLNQTCLESPVPDYDMMSWKPSTPIKRLPSEKGVEETYTHQLDEAEYRHGRKEIGQYVQNVDSSNVVMREVSHHVAETQTGDRECPAPSEGDIWQAEASRALDGPSEAQAEPLELQDLFPGEIPKPRRSKLPRTWRRISGNDFHYSDSPEPEPFQHPPMLRKTSSGSGVLTPPSTEDEDGTVEEDQDSASDMHGVDESGNQILEDAISPSSERDLASLLSDGSGDTTSEDDTGTFWQNNLPTVFGKRERPPPRTSKLDTIDMLERNSDDGDQGAATMGPAKHSPIKMRPFDGKIKWSPKANSSVISTPLRSSLLKSSKVRTSPYGMGSAVATAQAQHAAAESGGTKNMATGRDSYSQNNETLGDSVASDTRQLLAEVNKAQHRDSARASSGAPQTSKIADHVERPDQEEGTVEYSMSEYMEDIFSAEDTQFLGSSTPMRSYEERLNVASPSKVLVNFNDTSSIIVAPVDKSLASRRDYQPLFKPIKPTTEDADLPVPDADASEVTSIVSRMASTLWT